MINKRRGIYVVVIVLGIAIFSMVMYAQTQLDDLIDARLASKGIEARCIGSSLQLQSRAILVDTLELAFPSGTCISLSGFKLSGIDLFHLILNQGVSADTLFADSLVISSKPITHEDQKSDSPSSNLPLAVRNISLRTAYLAWANDKQDSLSASFALSDISFENGEILNEGQLQITNFRYYDNQESLLLESDSIDVALGSNTVACRNIGLSSTLSISDFIKKFPVQKDRIMLNIPSLYFANLDLERLLQGQNIASERILIEQPTLAVYRNNTLMPNTAIKPLFTEMIESSPLPIDIDTITVFNGNIQYTEQHHVDVAGQVSFTKLYAQIFGVNSNLDHSVLVKAQALVQSEGLLKVTINLGNQNKRSTVVGHLSAMDLSKFSTMSVPVAGVNIMAGKLNDMHFDFSYNQTESTGDLTIDYTNLKIALHDAQTGSATFMHQVGSFVANTFKVRSYNQANQKSYVRGKVKFRRDQTKSEISYWWKSIFSGLKSVVWIAS